jgi:ribonucleoside-diphosphate reductase beta chain
LEAYIDDPVEKEHLKNATRTIASIRKKAEWFRKYIQNGNYVQREVAGAISEGIFFSGAFCSIFWLKKQGKMPGLCDSNEFISRDEGVHRDVEALVYSKYIERKLPEEEVIRMVTEAVEVEIEFCTQSLPVELVGMKSESMIQYIKYVSDHLLMSLIGKKHYYIENPFVWMLMISLNVNCDFFANRPTSYSKQQNLTDKEENIIRFDVDF